MHRADIHAVDLELTGHGPLLRFVPQSGRTRTVLLPPGFRERLAALYPEIGTSDGDIELSPRLGRVMYTMAALAIIGFLVVAVVMYERMN